MTTIEQLSIPPALKILVRKPPLIKGELKEDYYSLLEEIVGHIGPSDAAEYIWTFSFTNWAWEMARYTNARALLIDHKIWPALREIADSSRKLVEIDGTWLLKNYQTELPNHGIDPGLVMSKATLRAKGELDCMDKMIDGLQRRCDTIMQLLEGRRDVFEARARQKAAEIRERELH